MPERPPKARARRSTTILAIDGPAGSGKSTTARLVARRLGFRHIDTGAMYRAVTLAVVERGWDLENPKDRRALQKFLRSMDLRLEGQGRTQRVFLNGVNVSRKIRFPQVTARVSEVASRLEVRQALIPLQRALGREENVVLEGRDIGTAVFPDADLKVFLTASLTERARRRLAEQGLTPGRRGWATALREQEQLLRARDVSDMRRPLNPLKVADDAVVVDTTRLSIPEQVEAVLRCVEDRLGQRLKP